MFQEEYDVIGAGTLDLKQQQPANLGSKTLLITMSLQNIAQMSCNPAMGNCQGSNC
jgi:tRNA uridine 5-carboxymethylaminomethyl modification enzyme